MKNSNQKYYFSVALEDERSSFFEKAASDALIAEIWQKGQDKDKVEEFDITSFDHETKKLHLKFKGGLLSKLTGSKNKDQNILIKISFQSIYIFTSSKLTFNKDDDSYEAIVDQDIYKSQQRSNYRLNANRFILIQFKIDNEVFSALDISAGGTSFTIPAEMKDRFVKDAVHEGCVVRLANMNYIIPESRVAGIWDHAFKDEKGNIIEGYKVGVAFIDLPKKTEEELFLTINTEARGEELRKKALEKKAQK
jgi:hypothetical protein